MQRFIRILIVIFVLTLVWPSFGTSGPMERNGDFSYLERLTSLPSDSIPTSLLPSTTQLEKISPLVLEATDDGVQTDFLVVLTEQADLTPSYALPTKKMRGRWVYETLWETAQHSQAPLRAWLGAKRVPYRSFYIVNLIYVQAGDRALVEELAARSDVVRIEANPRIQNVEPWTMGYSAPMSTQAIEWNITQVGAPEVWAMGYTGHGVVIGGQGTGYDWDHPALRNQYRGWNGSIADHNYNWHDAVHSGGGVCGPDSPEPCDDQGFGTHTMGTAVGDDGGSNQIGLAPGARWIGCRNMNQGFGTPTTYLECFEFFLAPYPVGGTPDDGDPDMAPDVTNNSWSCPPSEGCSWDTLQAAVEAHRAAGIMTVVAAGNDGFACSTLDDPPGNYDASYSVGATDNIDNIASFSSRGPVTVDGSNRLKPDISAPGVDIRSSVPGGGYQGGLQGTSMASPHVAGAVALIWSAQPALRNHIVQTEEIINTTAVPRYSTQCGDPPDTLPNNVYGWGRLDVLVAVNRLINRECISDVDCDDQNPCTTDTCVDGCCEHIPLADGTSCNDKKFCTKTDTCQDGVCVGSGNPCPPNCACDENNDNCDCPETETICDDGIDNDNDGSTDCLDSDCEGLVCNDGDPCTEDDTCSGGRCVGTSIDCDDGNDCTDDSCEAGQCVYECNATSFADSCCDDPVCADALVCKPITPPEITSSPVTTATVNILYSYDVECNPSEDIYNMVFSLNTSPYRMNLDEETGLITWTPTFFQLGDHSVEVKVEDEYEQSDIQEFVIHVSLFPWCPMSLAIENEKDLNVIRKFRDKRLSSVPMGQDYVNLFYKHSDEITLILLLNPDLISHTAEAIGKLLPVVDPLIKGESIYIDMETIEEIDSLLDEIEAKASPSLKTTILKIKKDVSRGEIFEQLRIIISE